MLERKSLTLLPSSPNAGHHLEEFAFVPQSLLPVRRTSRPNPQQNQVFSRTRANLYSDTDTRIIPPVAVSVYESVLFNLHHNGQFGDLNDWPRLVVGPWEQHLGHRVWLKTNLIIEDDLDNRTSYVAVTIEYRNAINDVILLERVEATEQVQPHSIQVPGILLEAIDSIIELDDMELEEVIKIPGDHSGPRYLTIERDSALISELDVTPIDAVYRSPFARDNDIYPRYAPDSVGAIVPSEECWTVAESVLTWRRIKPPNREEFRETLGVERLHELSQDNSISEILKLLHDADFPTILIFDESPDVYSERLYSERYSELEESYNSLATVVRVTWPVHLYLMAVHSEALCDPGTVWVRFPTIYRKMFNVSNMEITIEQMEAEIARLGTRWHNEDDYCQHYWVNHSGFDEALNAAFIPCTELHPDYVRLRQEAERLREKRRTKELADIEQTREQLRVDREYILTRSDDVVFLQRYNTKLYASWDEEVEKSSEKDKQISHLQHLLDRNLSGDNTRPISISGASGKSGSVSSNVNPIWSFASVDLGGPWKFSAIPQEDLADVLQKLGSFEGMTWEQLGSRGCHEVRVDELDKQARDRLRQLNQNSLDKLYSIRMDGRSRIWGIRRQNVIQILWWDPQHLVYPSLKKHT